MDNDVVSSCPSSSAAALLDGVVFVWSTPLYCLLSFPCVYDVSTSCFIIFQKCSHGSFQMKQEQRSLVRNSSFGLRLILVLTIYRYQWKKVVKSLTYWSHQTYPDQVELLFND